MALFAYAFELEEFRRWLTERASALRLTTEIVPIGKTDGWGFRRSVLDEGPFETASLMDVSRADGKFFRVVGARIERMVDGQVQRWGQPLIAGSKAGHVVFLRENEERTYLVQALAEPGNAGLPGADGQETRVLAAATFQASPDNVDRAMAALGTPDAPPALARYLPLVRAINAGLGTWTSVCEDGGRFFEKRNHYGVVEVPTRAAGEELMADAAPDARDFLWVDERVLQQAMMAGLVNSHGVQAYGVAKAQDPVYFPETS